MRVDQRTAAKEVPTANDNGDVVNRTKIFLFIDSSSVLYVRIHDLQHSGPTWQGTLLLLPLLLLLFSVGSVIWMRRIRRLLIPTIDGDNIKMHRRVTLPGRSGLPSSTFIVFDVKR